MKEKVIRVKHSGASGDIIYSMPALKRLSEINDNAGILLLINLNQPNVGAAHPGFQHAYGEVMVNEYAFKMLKPLLLEFEFILDVLPYKGQAITYDLDKFRHIGLNLGAFDIQRWQFMAYPELTCNNLEEPTFKIEIREDKYEPYIVVNRSHRYLNGNIDYSYLNTIIGKNIFFVGLPSEYDVFKTIVPKAVYYKVDDFLELAEFISDADLFIGNQSMCFAIAEQLKCNRILEVFYGCPNVIPHGGKYFQAWDDNGFQYAINTLLK